MIASAVMNAVGGKKSGGSFAPKDFFRFPAIGQQSAAPTDRRKAQAAIEAGWRAWAEGARAVGRRKGMVVD